MSLRPLRRPKFFNFLASLLFFHTTLLPTPYCYSQVYRARIKTTGQEVAVKVQRPGLEPKIVLDAHVLRWLAAILQRLFKTRSDLRAVADQLVGRL